MEPVFRKAVPGEEAAVYALIADRVDWMDREGISQWNRTDYLNRYPQDYYRQNLDRLYVLAEPDTGRVLCAAVLLQTDARWQSEEPALYIHNFVSALHSGGAGTAFLRQAERLAAELGKRWLRLDSADDNRKLEAYYEAQGFAACGVCQDGPYHGVLRQKPVQAG